MLSGETVAPPRVMGPPQPTPMASGAIGDDATVSSSRSPSVLNSPSGPAPCVGARPSTSTSPADDTTATASFVPPMSTAATVGPPAPSTPMAAMGRR